MLLAYVESPFQLLQAAEVVNNRNDYLIVVRLNSNSKNNAQLKEVRFVYELANVWFMPVYWKPSVIIFFIPLLLLALGAESVYFGDDNSVVFKAISRFIHNRKITLLDDGVATLNSDNNLHKRLSIFPLPNAELNRLEKTKSLTRLEGGGEEVNVIIGGKLLEEGICSRNTYYEVLRKIQRDMSLTKRRTIYVAHRGETEENIRLLTVAFGFDIVKSDLPIELLGYEYRVNPMIVSSVLSTALCTMAMIYNNAEVRAYPLCHKDIYSRVDAIDRIYEQMRNNSFGIIMME